MKNISSEKHTRINQIHQKVVARLGLLGSGMFVLSSVLAGDFVKVPPAFPPTVPTSTLYPVDYSYNFTGNSFGDIECSADTIQEVSGHTTETALVNNAVVSDHETLELHYFAIYPTCANGMAVSDYSCKQSRDGMTGTFNPSVDMGPCNYANGAFMGTPIFGPTGGSDCQTTVMDYSEGPIVNGVPSWKMWYTHPTYEPYCYYFTLRTCQNRDDANAACHYKMYGNSAYYNLVLHLEPGVQPPPLPIQQPVIGGSGSSCANGVCALPIVTWWILDGNAVDTVGLNNGTLGGSYSFSAGEVGNAITLSAANSGVTVPSSSDINFGANADFSIDAWIKPQSVTTDFGVMDIVDKRNTPNDWSCLGYEFCVVSGQLTFQMSDSLSTSPLLAGPAGADLRDGLWHHVAVTVQRGSSTGGHLYVDGQSIATFDPTSHSGSLVTTEPLLIGKHPSSWHDCNFRGGLDEVSVYNGALSAAQVQYIYQAGSSGKPSGPCTAVPNNLAAWWSVDGSAMDVLGANNGTLTGNNVGFDAGEVGASLQMTGPSSGISVPSSSALNVGANADFSIEAWIKPQVATTYGGVMDIVDKRSTPNQYVDVALGYELCVVSGRLTFQMSDSLNNSPPPTFGPAGSDLRDGAWHHVAVTVHRGSSTGGTLYVDGQSVLAFDTTTGTGSLATNEPLLIGMHPSQWLDANFRGNIDEVSLYSRALTSSEIQGLYRAFGGGKCRADQ